MLELGKAAQDGLAKSAEMRYNRGCFAKMEVTCYMGRLELRTDHQAYKRISA